VKIHRNAVEAAIRAAGSQLTDADKPLVELVRALAKQMDEAGEPGPGTRLAATYLTTVRTLASRIPAKPSEKPSKLAELRASNASRRSA